MNRSSGRRIVVSVEFGYLFSVDRLKRKIKWMDSGSF